MNDMNASEKRMYDALMAVWKALEEGALVAVNPTQIKEFVLLMSTVQGAIVQAQGGHRGKIDSDS